MINQIKAKSKQINRRAHVEVINRGEQEQQERAEREGMSSEGEGKRAWSDPYVCKLSADAMRATLEEEGE